MLGKLVRLESENNNLRTKEVVGSFKKLPCVGESFEMMADSLLETELVSFRVISTSIVIGVKQESMTYYFDTLRSRYRLELLEAI